MAEKAPTRLVAVALAALSALAQAGCGETELPAIGAALTPEDGSDPPPPHTRCVVAMLYTADGDLFRFRSYAMALLKEDHSAGIGLVPGGTGNAAPPIGTLFRLDGYNGVAALSWAGNTVDMFALDRSFIESGETKVLGFDAPDGLRYEFHIYGSTHNCSAYPSADTVTREEVDELES